jgi:hypothetical protein
VAAALKPVREGKMWTATVWLLWAFFGHLADVTGSTGESLRVLWRRYLYDRNQHEEIKQMDEGRARPWWLSLAAALAITGAAVCATVALNR